MFEYFNFYPIGRKETDISLIADYKVLVLGSLRLNILRAYEVLCTNKHLLLIFEVIGQLTRVGPNPQMWIMCWLTYKIHFAFYMHCPETKISF